MSRLLHDLTEDALLRLPVAQSTSYELGCYTDNPLGMHWCALADITAAFGGQGIFALMIAGLVFFAGYSVTDGDIVTPSVVLILLGGILIPSLPPQFRMLAATLMFAGGVGAVMQLLDRFVFGGSV